MKPKNALLSILVLGILLLSQTTKAQLSIGPKFAYNSLQQNAGLGLQVGIIAKEKFKLTSEFIDYFSKFSTSSEYAAPLLTTHETSSNLYEFNCNFSYILKFDKIYFYPIAGMNIVSYYTWNHILINNTSTSTKLTDNKDESTQTKVGLNLGGGAQYNLGLISPFLEFKYSLSALNNATISGGVMFNFFRGKR